MNTDRSLPELTKDVAAQLGEMFRNELRLARAETMENVRHIASRTARLAIGAVLAVASATMLLWALAAALTLVMPLWAGALVAAILGGIAAYSLVSSGRKAFAPDQFALPRTTQQVANDINFIKDKVSS